MAWSVWSAANEFGDIGASGSGVRTVSLSVEMASDLTAGVVAVAASVAALCSSSMARVLVVAQ